MARCNARAAVILAVAVWSSGCGARPCPTRPIVDASFAVEQQHLSRGPIRVIRASARADQRGREGRIRGEVLMFIEHPDRVRFDAMTQFGPASILTSNGTTFALTDLRESRFLTGPTCARNIQRLLGIPMDAADVARFLLGDTPMLEASSRTIECTDDGTYLVTLLALDGQRQEIELDVSESERGAAPEAQHPWIVRSEVFDQDGDTLWRVTFDDYRPAVTSTLLGGTQIGYHLPFEVRFEHPSEQADVLLKFDSIDVNVSVPDGAFEQSPRAGVAVETVGCE